MQLALWVAAASDAQRLLGFTRSPPPEQGDHPAVAPDHLAALGLGRLLDPELVVDDCDLAGDSRRDALRYRTSPVRRGLDSAG